MPRSCGTPFTRIENYCPERTIEFHLVAAKVVGGASVRGASDELYVAINK